MIDAYPLKWPEAWPRNQSPQPSRFATSLTAALKNVRQSLELFGKDSKKPVTDIVISSNVSLGNDNPKDTGVAVWFAWEGSVRCIAVDRYKKVQENLQAIYLIIESRRTELRHGGLHILRQAFAGFKALPERAGGKNCWDILGMKQTKDAAAIKEKYREMVKSAHPQNGGSQEQLNELMKKHMHALPAVQDNRPHEFGGDGDYA